MDLEARDGADTVAERNCKEQWDNKDIVDVVNGGIARAGVVIGCSALKKWYRDILRGNVDAIPPPTNDLVSHLTSFHITPRLPLQLQPCRTGLNE